MKTQAPFKLTKETLVRIFCLFLLCLWCGSCIGKDVSKVRARADFQNWDSVSALFQSVRIAEERVHEDGIYRNYYWAEIDYFYTKDDALYRSQHVYPEEFFSDDFRHIETQIAPFSPLENLVLVNPDYELQSLAIAKQPKAYNPWVPRFICLVGLVSCFFILGWRPQIGLPVILGVTLLGFFLSYSGPKDTSYVELDTGGELAYKKLLQERTDELNKDSELWQKAKGQTIAELREHFGKEQFHQSGNGIGTYHFKKRYWPKHLIATVKEDKISEVSDFFKY